MKSFLKWRGRGLENGSGGQPLHDRQPSAYMEDLHMKTFDLGGEDDDTKRIQQTTCLRRSVRKMPWRWRRLRQWWLQMLNR